MAYSETRIARGVAKRVAKMYLQLNTSINKNQYLVSNPFQ